MTFPYTLKSEFSAMTTIALSQTLVELATEGTLSPSACSVPASSFAEKIRLVSNVTCKEEEFNVWHANADKAIASFVWGGLAKSEE